MAQDFTLADAADFTHQLSGVEWLDALPADTREDRRLKELFRVTCTECHQAGLVLQNRFDERGWRAMIDLMANVSYHGWRGSSGRRSLTIEYYRDELAAYLTKARGPESPPLTFELQPRPTGEAARHVVTEYDIPIAELPTERTSIDGSDWSEGIPSGMRGGGGMHDAAVDDDGNVWITDSVPNDFRTLARIDPRTGQVTGFKVTAPDGKRARRSHGITKARDGMMWFDTQGSLGRVDPKTETFELYTPPRPLSVGGSLQEDGRGNIWVGNRHGALKFDPATREYTYYQNKTVGDGQTYGTAADRLGNGWWAQFNMDIVGHANGTTGEVDEVPMRPPGALDREQLLTPADRDFFHRIGAMRFSGSVYNPGGQAPRRLAADPAGDTVWVANWWGSNLAKIDINTLEATYYHLPIGAHPVRHGGRPQPHGVDEPVVRRRRREIRSGRRGVHDLQAPQPRGRAAPHRGRRRGRPGRLGRVPGGEPRGPHPVPDRGAARERPRRQRAGGGRRGRRPVAETGARDSGRRLPESRSPVSSASGRRCGARAR